MDKELSLNHRGSQWINIHGYLPLAHLFVMFAMEQKFCLSLKVRQRMIEIGPNLADLIKLISMVFLAAWAFYLMFR